MSISAVILDLDGVLIDTESVARRAWFQAAVECGFQFSDDLYANVVGRPVASCRQVVQSVLPDGISFEYFLKCSDHLYHSEMEQNGVAVMDGIPELLNWIEQTDLEKSIATSSGRESAEMKLELAGLSGRIEIMVTSDDVKQGKPAPDLFFRAAELMNQPLGDCAVIDDAEAGIIGAANAGTIPIMVPTVIETSANVQKLATAIVDTVPEAHSFLKSLCAN